MATDLQRFSSQIERLETASGKSRKGIVKEILDNDDWQECISFIVGEEFDNIGIGKTSAVNALVERVDDPSFESRVEEEGSVEEAVKVSGNFTQTAPVDGGTEIDTVHLLYNAVKGLEAVSGGEQLEKFASIVDRSSVSWVAAYAVVHDKNIGIGKKTVCKYAAQTYGYSKEDINRGYALIPDPVEFIEACREKMDITTLTVDDPFDPMLAKNADLPEGAREESNYVAQLKLDGYRCVVHVKEGEARAYSRNRKDKTDVLPELKEIDWPEGEFIFDAEVMADDGSYTSTSERMQSKSTRDELPHEMNFWAFDLLHIDGTDISDWHFEERATVLEDFIPENDRVKMVEIYDDLDKAVEVADDNGYEGVIFKHIDHEYRFGKRSSDWIKHKLTRESVELKIVNYDRGTGEDTEMVGALLLETMDGQFKTRVGTGFSDEQRRDMWENFEQDYLGEVAEISFDVDEGYSEGLRFPAFEGLRDDKDDADTLERMERNDWV